MLKIGLVGKNNVQTYISAISNTSNLQLSSIYDPSFQFEANKSWYKGKISKTYNELLQNSNGIVFTSTERIYLPLIEQAIKEGKPVFLDSTTDLSIKDHTNLFRLSEESNEIIQVYHPLLFNNLFKRLLTEKVKPLVCRVSNTGANPTKLMQILRHDISTINTLVSANIKAVNASCFAIFNDFPDTYQVNLIFENGCKAEFLVDGINKNREHCCIGYAHNQHFNLDIFNNKGNFEYDNLGIRNTEKVIGDKNFEALLAIQFQDFYKNIITFKTPKHGIENELATQMVIEKVKEKVRFSFNII